MIVKKSFQFTNVFEAFQPRPRRYLVAANQDELVTADMHPVDAALLLDVLDKDSQVTVERIIVPSLRLQSLLPLGLSPRPLDQVIVAEMPEETANQLRTHPQVVIEEDELLRPVVSPSPVVPPAAEDPTLFVPFGSMNSWSIRLQGPSGEPVTGAAVYLYGSGLPVQGTSDQTGTVSLSLLNDTDDSIKSIYINPKTDYWNVWADRPTLVSGQQNIINLIPLGSQLPQFPQRQLVGWGQRLMRMDQLPAELDGAGIQVAVVDSGAAATTHPDLLGITRGQDMTVAPSTDTGWEQDIIAHGSHCSGVIAGANNTSGIRGFAPAAKVHECRVFPGGRLSSLLDAIDYCIDHDIDVVNMSLGGGGTNQLALQKLSQAKQAGIACIVAAGNTGGPVAFPGSSPDVLTVAAMGKIGEYPDTSYHAKLQWKEGPSVNGLFSAQFSCHGPEVDVCAPGVAVVSSVPDRGYAAWDGTSMAAPHVTGLAALLLAHHPDLRGTPKDANRVNRLFKIITDSATALDVGDTHRTGAGVPDAITAMALRLNDGPLPTHNGQHSNPPDNPPTQVQQLIDQIRLQMTQTGLLN